MPTHVAFENHYADDISPEERKIADELHEECMEFIQGLVGMEGVTAISGVPDWFIGSFGDSVAAAMTDKNSKERLVPLLVEFGVWLGARMRHVKQIS